MKEKHKQGKGKRKDFRCQWGSEKKNCHHHHYMKLEIIMTTLYNYDFISFTMVTSFIL